MRIKGVEIARDGGGIYTPGVDQVKRAGENLGAIERA